MNEQHSKKQTVYGALAAALILAAALMLLFVRAKRNIVFAEFSPSDALDGKSDCYLNTLRVLDRYAEQVTGKTPSELMLVSYLDRDETEVVLSLLVEPDEALYALLAPYYADSEATHELVMLSGYFFCEALDTHNRGASEAFEADASDYAAWRQNAGVVSVPVVLRFAGETEQDYTETLRMENRATWITVAILAGLAVLCGVRFLTLRAKRAG